LDVLDDGETLNITITVSVAKKAPENTLNPASLAYWFEHVRKGKPVPYISHLISVSALVWEDAGSEDQAIAALRPA
jgi:hypothetical protein